MNITENIIELGFSVGLFVNALLFLPQAIRLYKVKDPTGLSLLTFGGFNIIQLFFILHAILKHDYLLLFGISLSLITCGTITVMMIFYRLTKPKLDH